ncbi:MAG: hypothetical protein K2G56_05460 [Eubacterium sp.]|nr:hypothetical protein [Eubacterium sp.]
MIKAENILNKFISRILDDRYFADVQVTRAYPNAVKPTILKNTAVAVGIKSIELDDNAINENVKAGTFSVFTDIFLPFESDQTVPESIVFRICRDVSDFNIVSISISEIKANSLAQCYVMRAVFTFNNELSFGGDNYE